MMKMLKRMENPRVIEQDCDADFAERCSKELGYKGGQHQRKAVEQSALALEALREVGLTPFTAASVAQYKAKAQLAMLPLWFKLLALVPPSIILGSVALAFVNPNWLCGILVALVTSIPWCMAYDLKFKYVWETDRLEFYGQPIPEFALQTALDVTARLKKQSVEHTWVVEHLQKKQVVADPFLVLQVGSQSFHVEVWNEPGFKQKREA